MRSLRLSKNGPTMERGKHAFLTRGSSMRFVDNPGGFHVENIMYFKHRFDVDFNKFAAVWQTSTPMVSSTDLQLIYEITQQQGS